MAQITLNSTGVASNGSLVLQSNGTTAAVTVDASQVVGVGITPSAWASDRKVLQVNRGSLIGSNSNETAIGNNYYWNGTSNIYIATAPSTIYSQGTNGHAWFQAASGTAGNAITFTQAMTLDTSGNLGVGVTSTSQKLHIAKNGTLGIRLDNQATNYWDIENNSNLLFSRGGTEYARIDSSGNLLLGTTSQISSGYFCMSYANNARNGIISNDTDTGGGTNIPILFNRNGSTAGSVSTSATSTSFNTSSDYRLKNTIVPMTNALAKVSLLKPCTYKWNLNGSDSEGFIAHELSEVFPQAVSGEKDAVNEDGSIKPQGIDTSFLVATLTAAIQEQQALITQLQADVAALKA